MILGSGTSFGVPVIGCSCKVCTSEDPRDARTRVAALVESTAGNRILIDTPPELRLQLLRAGVGSVDAVLYTHEHADHVHGIDDLRAVSVSSGALPLYGPRASLDEIVRRFGYIFDGTPAPEQSSKPELAVQSLSENEVVTIAGMTVLPIEFDHGRMKVFGYRFGPVAYLTDVKNVPSAAMARLSDLDVLVINALFERSHPAHLSIPEAIEVARSVRARRTILTHLTHRYGHAELVERLPGGVEPAYDGMVIEVPQG